MEMLPLQVAHQSPRAGVLLQGYETKSVISGCKCILNPPTHLLQAWLPSVALGSGTGSHISREAKFFSLPGASPRRDASDGPW